MAEYILTEIVEIHIEANSAQEALNSWLTGGNDSNSVTGQSVIERWMSDDAGNPIYEVEGL